MLERICSQVKWSLAVGTMFALSQMASASTVGLWTMEDLFDSNGEDPAGERTSDVSDNGLHLTRTQNFGSMSLNTDVASVQPAGTTSMNVRSAGARNIITPGDDRLAAGKTGQFAVEFWLKPDSEVAVDTIMYFVAATRGSGAADDGWGVLARNTGDKSDFGFQFFHRDSAGGNHSITTAETYDANNPTWMHVAATVDTAQDRAWLYVDGVEVGTNPGFGNSYTAAATDTLVLGTAPGSGGGFAGKHNIDDLRISDVALLPGNGTGVGELAWNATLIPAPATLALVGLGGLTVFRRERVG